MRSLALLLAAVALALLSSCGGPDAPKNQKAAAVSAAAKPAPLVVETVLAQTRKSERVILVTGSLAPDETVTIVSEVAGRVTSMPFDFGQSVRRGEVVAELEKTEYQLQVERGKAALAQALARLGLDPSQIVPSQSVPQRVETPAMRQARAQLEDARSKFESAQRLVKSGDIAQERFTETEKSYRARQAAFDAAEHEMRTLLASAQALRAELELAEKRLRDTVIRAPFDGAVSEKRVAPGQYVKDNAPLLVLVKTHPMRLRLEVPETAAGVVRAGTELEFTTGAAPGASFRAVVRQLNPSLNEQSRTLVAEARLTRSDPRLRPGMFVQVRLLLERGVEVTAVPREAVYSVAGLTKVFTVKEGKLVEHRITPGEVQDGWMMLPDGAIQPGDAVVTGNLAQLFDGQAVSARPKKG